MHSIGINLNSPKILQIGPQSEPNQHPNRKSQVWPNAKNSRSNGRGAKFAFATDELALLALALHSARKSIERPRPIWQPTEANALVGRPRGESNNVLGQRRLAAKPGDFSSDFDLDLNSELGLPAESGRHLGRTSSTRWSRREAQPSRRLLGLI